MIFRHGIRWSWLDQNPVMMVRVSSKRLRRPDALTAEEFRALLAGLPDRQRLLGMNCATTGVRTGEALGLKWQDIRFDICQVDVLRSFDRSDDGKRIGFGISGAHRGSKMDNCICCGCINGRAQQRESGDSARGEHGKCIIAASEVCQLLQPRQPSAAGELHQQGIEQLHRVFHSLSPFSQ